VYGILNATLLLQPENCSI